MFVFCFFYLWLSWKLSMQVNYCSLSTKAQNSQEALYLLFTFGFRGNLRRILQHVGVSDQRFSRSAGGAPDLLPRPRCNSNNTAAISVRQAGAERGTNTVSLECTRDHSLGTYTLFLCFVFVILRRKGKNKM